MGSQEQASEDQKAWEAMCVERGFVPGWAGRSRQLYEEMVKHFPGGVSAELRELIVSDVFAQVAGERVLANALHAVGAPPLLPRSPREVAAPRAARIKLMLGPADDVSWLDRAALVEDDWQRRAPYGVLPPCESPGWRDRLSWRVEGVRERLALWLAPWLRGGE